jgi:hypothetical protein
MAKSFQEKLEKILRESSHNPEKKDELKEDQTNSPTRVHPEGGQEVTHGIDGTGKIDANGPIPTGLDKTLKTQPGPTTAGPTGHIPTSGDLPKALFSEEDDKKEDDIEEGKTPPFLKKKDDHKEPDGDEKPGAKGDGDSDDKEKKEVKEEDQSKAVGKDGAEANARAGYTKKSAGDGEKFNEELDHEEGDKSEPKLDEEKEEDEEDKKAVEEAKEKLFQDEEFSEAFKVKTAAIFEEVLSARIKAYRSKIKTQMVEQLNEKTEEIRTDLTEKVNGHLDLVVENWVKTHEVALENALKNQLVEEFITGLKSLFEEHYIEIPDSKVDVIAEMANKVTSLEGKLNEQIETNVALQGKIRLAEKTEVFNEVAKGLAATQVEKLRSLAETVEYQSQEQYKKALTTLKESSMSTSTAKPAPASGKTLAEQTLEQNPATAETSKQTAAVKDVLARMAKK